MQEKIIKYALIIGFLILTICYYASVSSQKAHIEHLEYQVGKLKRDLEKSNVKLTSRVYSLEMKFKDMTYYLDRGEE